MPEKHATMPDESKPGRPPGSPNKEYPEVDADAPRCRAFDCQSTELEVLKRLPDQWYGGERNGEPYTVIVRRRVRCKVCGSVMIVATYENRKKPRPPKTRSKK